MMLGGGVLCSVFGVLTGKGGEPTLANSLIFLTPTPTRREKVEVEQKARLSEEKAGKGQFAEFSYSYPSNSYSPEE